MNLSFLPPAPLWAVLRFESVERGWLWLLLVALGAWLLYATYRGMFERPLDRMTWALLALRALGVMALVVALARPAWVGVSESVDPGRVAVILDNSLSMSLADASGRSRYALAADSIKQIQEAIEDADGPEVECELFDIDGKKLDDPLPSNPRLERTDLARAVRSAAAQLRSKTLIGIVLVSDGVDNSGTIDVFPFAEMAAPISCVGFRPDPAAARFDLAVRSVQAPPRAMIDNEIQVDVQVSKSSGPATTGRVIVWRGSEELASAEAPLSDGDDERLVRLTFAPREAGSFVYTASVASEAGESVMANNARHFPMEVDAKAIRTLYVEGYLRYEYKYLKARLEDDPDVSVISFVRRANPERASGVSGDPIFTSERLKNLDLVILGDMEGDYLSESECRSLSDWVADGHALLVLGGYHAFGPTGFRATPLADALPVVFNESAPQQLEEPFTLELTERGRSHPIFQVTGDRVKDAALWKAAPPLLGQSVVQRIKPGAETLAVNPAFLVDGGPAPLIVAQRYGKGHAMVVAADTTWRWQRLPLVMGQNDSLYARFWSQTVRWLTGRDLDDRRSKLLVSTNRLDYEVGQEVVIRVARGAGLNDASQAAATMKVIDETGKRTAVSLRERSDQPGVQTGSFFPATSGRYRAEALLTSDGKLIANEAVEFLVQGADLELSNAEANRALLQNIAERTGGVYVDVEEASSLAEQLERRERRTVRNERRELWSSPWLFLVFLGAVTTEWIIRRRNHLV